MKELKLNKKIVANLNQVTGGKDVTNTCPIPIPVPVSDTITIKGADCQSNNCAPTEQNTMGGLTTCESIIMCTVCC